jgi:hypothetical protein
LTTTGSIADNGKNLRGITTMAKQKSPAFVQKISLKVKVTRIAAGLEPSDPIYSVHPSIAMVQRWIAEMQEKTGRTLNEWVEHVRQSGPATEKECREWLQSEYDFGANKAWWVVEKAFGKPLGIADETPDKYLAAAPKYVEKMYSGPRRRLRELHDKIIEISRSLGDDVRICPCKTIVPLYRRHVFAEINPASPSQIDLGFALLDEPFTARLVDTSRPAKKNRITHKVAICKISDIDLQVRRWLKQSYELDG